MKIARRVRTNQCIHNRLQGIHRFYLLHKMFLFISFISNQGLRCICENNFTENPNKDSISKQKEFVKLEKLVILKAVTNDSALGIDFVKILQMRDPLIIQCLNCKMGTVQQRYRRILSAQSESDWTRNWKVTGSNLTTLTQFCAPSVL